MDMDMDLNVDSVTIDGQCARRRARAVRVCTSLQSDSLYFHQAMEPVCEP